jgi:hypothetical protein
VQSTAPTHPENFCQRVRHARERCGPWPTHEIFRMLSTMSRRRKSSNCSPRALLEVKNAFNNVTGPSLILLASNLSHPSMKRRPGRRRSSHIFNFVCRRRHWESSSVLFM